MFTRLVQSSRYIKEYMSLKKLYLFNKEKRFLFLNTIFFFDKILAKPLLSQTAGDVFY